jgi:hypothetical protein
MGLVLRSVVFRLGVVFCLGLGLRLAECLP